MAQLRQAGLTDDQIRMLADGKIPQGWQVHHKLPLDDDEHFNAYMVFGEGNVDLYVRHLPTGEYQVIDRTPGNLIETHPSFDQLVAAALKAHL